MGQNPTLKYDPGHNSTLKYDPGQFLKRDHYSKWNHDQGSQFNRDPCHNSMWNRELAPVTIQRGIANRGQNSTW